MPPGRLTTALLLGIGLAFLLSGSAWCREKPPLAREEGGDPPEAEAHPPDHPPDRPLDRPAARPPGRGRGPQGAIRGYRQAADPARPRVAGPNRPGRFDPRGPRGRMHPAGPPRWPFHNWDALERTDPEMYKLLKQDSDLERRTRELAIQYRRASGEQRPEIRRELEKLVAEHFQVRQDRRLLELKRLEEELARLREAIQRRDDARQTLVHDRVLELLGEEDDLDF